MIGGQIQVMFTTVASAASLIGGGQLRALAVPTAERSPAFPQLPTVAETGLPGFEAETWYGLFAPAKTPPDIIDRLNKSAAKAVQALPNALPEGADFALTLPAPLETVRLLE